MPYKDPAKQKAARARYRARDREKLRDIARELRKNNPGLDKRRATDEGRLASNVKARIWRSKNRAKVLATNLRKYGISIDDLNRMFLAQSGLCMICIEPLGRHAIDHCHSTGNVRGLLCNKCNLSLGGFRDDPNILRRAADYLETAKLGKTYQESGFVLSALSMGV